MKLRKVVRDQQEQGASLEVLRGTGLWASLSIWVVKAEVKAVFRGCKIAREMSIHKLWVRLDSKAVVAMLSNHVSGHLECQALI